MRRKIMVKSGLREISPDKCKYLSEQIEYATGKKVSVTTLKRFFGFAIQKYDFSKYSLNAFAEYAGYNSWKDFEVMNMPLSTEVNVQNVTAPWEELIQLASEITTSSLSYIESVCGIPFEFTKLNKIVRSEFHLFMRSSQKVFFLTGIPLSGKSIQIAHIVRDLMLIPDTIYKDSIPCLIKINNAREYLDLSTAQARGLKLWGIDMKLIDACSKTNHKNRKLILFIDGIEKQVGNSATNRFVTNQILNILLLLEKYHWIKVIFTIRFATYNNFNRLYSSLDFIKKGIWNKLWNNEIDTPNLTFLNIKDTREVIEKIHKKMGLSTPENLEDFLPLLRFPALIQFYYQTLKKHPSAPQNYYLFYVDVVQSFLKREIFTSALSIEKIQLIKNFINLTNIGSGEFKVNGQRPMDSKNFNMEAFRELIADGVLQESFEGNVPSLEVFISFSYEEVFNYFLAQELVNKPHKPSGTQILSFVIDNFTNKHRRKQIIY